MAELATEHGVELPEPLGVGLVYYYLNRDIEVSDIRVGQGANPPQSVSEYVQLSSNSEVHNLNIKVDAWLLPFLNVYAILGYIDNQSETRVDVQLPPLLPGGPSRGRSIRIPTAIEGTVGGLGTTLAGGYGPFFFAADINAAQADLGFDDSFKAVVSSLRSGWHGKIGSRPLRTWLNATYWNTFAEASGTAQDPDSGETLRFEVDQGPAYPWTYGVGASYTPKNWLDIAVDLGSDFHGGWYVALVPVIRF